MNKKIKIEIGYFYIIIVLSALSALIIDLFFINTGVLKFKFLGSLNQIVNKILDFQFVLLSILIATNFVMLQIYRNRYPVILYNEKICKNFIKDNKYLLFSITYGFVLIIIDYDFKISFYIYIFTSCFVFYISIKKMEDFINCDSINIMKKSEEKMMVGIKEF